MPREESNNTKIPPWIAWNMRTLVELRIFISSLVLAKLVISWKQRKIVLKFKTVWAYEHYLHVDVKRSNVRPKHMVPEQHTSSLSWRRNNWTNQSSRVVWLARRWCLDVHIVALSWKALQGSKIFETNYFTRSNRSEITRKCFVSLSCIKKLSNSQLFHDVQKEIYSIIWNGSDRSPVFPKVWSYLGPVPEDAVEPWWRVQLNFPLESKVQEHIPTSKLQSFPWFPTKTKTVWYIRLDTSFHFLECINVHLLYFLTVVRELSNQWIYMFA